MPGSRTDVTGMRHAPAPNLRRGTCRGLGARDGREPTWRRITPCGRGGSSVGAGGLEPPPSQPPTPHLNSLIRYWRVGELHAVALDPELRGHLYRGSVLMGRRALHGPLWLGKVMKLAR